MDPVFGLTYSSPKRGKTLAMIRAFPGALFLALKGGLKCASWLGLEQRQLNQMVADDVDQMIKIIRAAKAKYPAIVIDDATLQFDAEYARIKKKDSTWSGNDKFNKKIIELRDVCRDAPVHVFWTMHEQPPREVKKVGDNYGKLIPGTVLVPGWQLPEKLPAMVDFCARIVYDDSMIGWPLVYQTGPDEEFITGNRLSNSPTRFPLNIGELLRQAGYDVPCLKGFEWMEPVSEQLATKLVDNPEEVGNTLREASAKLAEKIKNQRHIRWALQNGIDRANLWRYQANLLDTFLDQYDNYTLE